AMPPTDRTQGGESANPGKEGGGVGTPHPVEPLAPNRHGMMMQANQDVMPEPAFQLGLETVQPLRAEPSAIVASNAAVEQDDLPGVEKRRLRPPDASGRQDLGEVCGVVVVPRKAVDGHLALRQRPLEGCVG